MPVICSNTGWFCRSKRPVTNNDMLSLFQLYQPIIGAKATALYTTLYYQLPLRRAGKSEVYGHTHLLKTCALSFEELLEARHLLEGIGLLNTYETADKSSEKVYEYEIIPPLTPLLFFQSDVLCITLYNLLGKDRYLVIKRQLLDTTAGADRSNDARDITRSFNDVFNPISPRDLFNSSEIVEEATLDALSDGKRIEIDDSNLSNVRMYLSSIVNEDSWTNSLVKQIKEIRFLYQLSDWDLVKALQNPYVTRYGVIDIDRLRSFVKNEYKLKFGGPPIIAKKKMEKVEQEVIEKNLNRGEVSLSQTEEELHLEQLESVSPLELLSNYQGGAKVPSSDVELVEELITQYELPYGVINVLLEYVLIKYDFKLPKNLVEKIAGHWKRLGVSSVKEAIKQAKKEDWELKKKRQEPTKWDKPKYKREEKIPRSLKGISSSVESKQNPAQYEDFKKKQARIQAKLASMREEQRRRQQTKGL